MTDIVDLNEAKNYITELIASASEQKLDGAALGAALQKKFDQKGLFRKILGERFLLTDGTGPGNHDYYLSSHKDSTSTVHRPAPKVVRKVPLKIIATADPSSDLFNTILKGLQAQIDRLTRQNEELLKRVAALEASSSSSGGILADA